MSAPSQSWSYKARAALMLAVAGCSVGHSPDLTVRREDGGLSRAPISFIGVPEKGLIRWPSLAVLGDTVFVAANVFQGESLLVRPAYLGRLRLNLAGDLTPLAPLKLPPGDFQFGYPRIIPAGSKLHLVWAEFGLRPRTTVAWQHAALLGKSLWHAVLDNGIWSAPEKIATGDLLGWDDETGSVAVDASGTLHVAVWNGDNGSVVRVRDFRQTDGRWDMSNLPYTSLSRATAIATRRDTAFIAFVAEEHDTARVMVLESIDHGKRWTNPIVVALRPWRQGTVTRLAFATTLNGLILAIGEKADDSFYLDTIRVLRLRGSSALPTTQFVPPPPMADQFVLAGTSCGSVIMLTRSLSTRPQIFQITIPTDSARIVSRPLLSSALYSTFPGVVRAGLSAIAVFAYTPTENTQPLNAAMPLPICPS